MTTNSTEIKKKTFWEYYEQLHTNNLDNLDEWKKFLEKQNQPRQNHEEIKNPNRL